MQRSKYICCTALAGALTLAAGVAYAAAPLPDGFTAQDIGKVKTGDTSVAGTGASAVWTLTSQGGDIQNKGDIFRFVSHDLAGDGGITARVLSQTGGSKGGWSKSGVMIRQSIDPGSVMDTMNFAFTGAKQAAPMLEVLHRDKAANNPAGYGVAARDPATGPIWLRAQRVGQDYQLLRSDNGKDWQTVDDRTMPIDATAAVVAGITTSSGNATDPPAVATFDNVSVSADIIQPDIVPGPSPIEVQPGNGQVLLTFPTVANASYNVYRQEAGSKTPAVLLTQQPDPYGWFVDTGLTNGTNYVYSISTVNKSLADPTKTVESASGTLSQVLATPQLPVAGLTSVDIGTMTPGTTTLDNNGMLTITASGGDIWNAADSFRLVGGEVSGDYSIRAKLLEKPAQGPKNTSTWVKAGVMIRESLDPSAREAWMVSTSGNGVQFGYRNVYNSSDAKALVGIGGTNNAKTTYPIFLMLSRSGDNVSGFQSSDGTTWTQVGTAISFPALSHTTDTGLAVTAHTSDQKTSDLLGSAKFDAASIQVEAPYTPPAAATTPPKA